MTEMLHTLLFYGFALLAFVFAAMTVFLKNTVHATLSLVGVFVAVAVTWLLLRVEFLSFILVIVYVGAVMTLFLFVVMMLNVTKETQTTHFGWHEKLLALMGGAIAFLVIITATIVPNHPHFHHYVLPKQVPFAWDNLAAFGMTLYTHHVLAFETAALILFVAMVAALMLTQKSSRSGKKQNPAKQIEINPRDRVRLIDVEQ